jgi:hypothetical protein
MKWFKHFTDASQDEIIVILEHHFGLEGYARWWKLLEIVGREMDKTDRCSASFPWPVWQQKLRGKRKKLETFLECLENLRRINLKQNENVLEIEIPNLLKIRDEYSQRSGHSTDTNREFVPHKNKEERIKIKEGADAPSLWSLGEVAGIPRSLTGKLIKQHGEERVSEAVAETIGKRPADPVGYVIGILRPKAKRVAT